MGTSTVRDIISALIVDQRSGNLSSEVIDLSVCDENIFYCEIDSWTTTWIYKGRDGSNYLFFEDAPSTSSCTDGNIIARLTGDNNMAFTWTDITDSSNTSTSTVMR